ncbi:5,6-dimethylbenzimidazole synthase [Natronospira proteinivora]|uniref:5,6-dimethylbenzimidazole synthase n=1 Tax=Natronospira proteinivora TaxID=1807133 RepID=A0ABT1G5W1_9GAMM|nr:5,6-dimethylbenzimidazole synthase [Natronospira proteinivora]MCP1726325.1 5,6-dimethylbenzimidazole synthase [Natronospira proteinivora]
MTSHAFSEAERAAVYRVIAERRDMRHFLPDPVSEDCLARVLSAAHQAPSVGLMQPWRFIRVTDRAVREGIGGVVEAERQRTAEALGEDGSAFMRLKVEGIQECGELLVVVLPDKREQHVFGRRTMPEMDLASAACAIQNLWLAARAEGLGMGWVSLFEPDALARLLALPAGASPIAVLCLGHVEAFYERPMLEQEGWTRAEALEHFLMGNRWDESKSF